MSSIDVDQPESSLGFGQSQPQEGIGKGLEVTLVEHVMLLFVAVGYQHLTFAKF